MKFMKLGSKPDTFYTIEAVRSVSSEVSCDLIIQVKNSKYLLHKFPLLSKCGRLQRLCCESTEPETTIQIPDLPGGVEAFEFCAKFCYGITITLSAYNIVSVRCAADYLGMTEDVEKGNLIYKLEVFLNSCILRGWKDSIVTLQTTKSYPVLSEDLRITSRCIEAIASRVLVNPSKVNWSYRYSRGASREEIQGVCNGTDSRRLKPIPNGWWAEDLSELGIDLYWRIMVSIKSAGKISGGLIGEALQVYAHHWLSGISNKQNHDSCEREITSKHRLLLESIISLLPTEKGSVRCSFLLKLLKAANLLGASSSSKMELARRVGFQLEEATVSDLLLPSMKETLYDVDTVQTIVDQFMFQSLSPPTSPPRTKGRFEKRRSHSADNLEFQEGRRSSSASHSSKLKVAKLVDGYLQEIAPDKNLRMEKMIALAQSIPDFARPDHDDLYRAIDIYLKAHLELDKSERKRLCQLLDCKKLSMEACTHAAQNELLPLRVVVQVLFFEQVRAAMASGQVTDLPSNIKALLTTHEDDASGSIQLSAAAAAAAAEDEWSVSGVKSPKLATLGMRLAEVDPECEDGVRNSSKFKAICSIPTRPKRMLSKLWSSHRSLSEKQ